MVLSFTPEDNLQTELNLPKDKLTLPFWERAADSPLIERVWYSYSDYGGSFTSTAQAHGEIVITKLQGHTQVTIRGPETSATMAECPPDAEFIGIVFKLGTFMPKFPAYVVMDRQDVNLPQAGRNTFWLDSSTWEFPSFENADVFIRRLVHNELIVNDPLVDAVIREHPIDLSRRTLQRRFLQATGLTYNKMFQIDRARYATNLLIDGLSILDVVEQAGYADQPHLTRAIKRFIGQTPGQIMNGALDQPLSFLFKTPPF